MWKTITASEANGRIININAIAMQFDTQTKEAQGYGNGFDQYRSPRPRPATAI
jgi:hypothetical protein